VASPETELSAVCEFCELPFEASTLKVPHVNSSYAAKDSSWRGFSADAAGSWRRGRLSPSEVFLCQRITANGMVQHRYSAVTVQPNVVNVAISLALLPLKLSLALVFNFTQARNIRQALKRRLHLAGRQG
jgi:hypothetical protein